MIGSIVTLVILVILNAIFASAEIAVISMNDAKLKRLAEDGNKRAVKLASLTEQPAKFLATIQVAITLAGQLGSAVAADRFAGPLAAVLVNAGVPVAEGVLRNIALVVITASWFPRESLCRNQSSLPLEWQICSMACQK